MKLNTHTNVWVTLEDDERFEIDVATGRILCDTINSDFMPRTVGVNGWAVLKDGSQGVIRRSDTVPMADIPVAIRTVMLDLMFTLLKTGREVQI